MVVPVSLSFVRAPGKGAVKRHVYIIVYVCVTAATPNAAADADDIAAALEDAIYNEFKSTETKYKNRVRSRIANLKVNCSVRVRVVHEWASLVAVLLTYIYNMHMVASEETLRNVGDVDVKINSLEETIIIIIIVRFLRAVGS